MFYSRARLQNSSILSSFTLVHDKLTRFLLLEERCSFKLEQSETETKCDLGNGTHGGNIFERNTSKTSLFVKWCY